VSALIIVLLAIIAIAVCVGAYAWLSPAKETVEIAPPPPNEPWRPDTTWTAQAGEEFATLSEAARCDLVFAVADLQDDRAEGLLIHALDDPSEAVALAAAHVLGKRGAGDRVRAHIERHPGARAERIEETLALLQ
jgi:HEAT repeat protein